MSSLEVILFVVYVIVTIIFLCTIWAASAAIAPWNSVITDEDTYHVLREKLENRIDEVNDLDLKLALLRKEVNKFNAQKKR